MLSAFELLLTDLTLVSCQKASGNVSRQLARALVLELGLK